MQAIILAGEKELIWNLYDNLAQTIDALGELQILEIIIRQLKYFGVTDIV